MIVKCKSNIDREHGEHNLNLTVGKLYTVIDIDNIGYKITNDKLNDFWYIKELFYSVQEFRDIKLKELGI
jgi:hypothetical protein